MNIDKLVAQGRPAPLEFPSFCNPHALNIWITVASDLPEDPRSAWKQVLRSFTLTCKEAGLLPFVPQSVVDIDQACRTFLKVRRNTLVRFANRSRLLADVKIWKRTTNVTREGYGFNLEQILHAEIPDPHWEKRLFRIPFYRFQRLRQGYEWQCRLDPALTFFVSTYNRGAPRSWTIGYRISCPLLIDSGIQPFTDYVLRRLWMPVAGWRPSVGDKIRRL